MEGLTKSLVVFGNASSGSGGNFPPDPCNNLVAVAKGPEVYITWTDPENSIVGDIYPVLWDKTVLVRKENTPPVNVNDGVIVVINDIRNQYETNPFIDSDVVVGCVYYYSVFPCSKNGVYNSEATSCSATPFNYRSMTVKIDLSNSNPATCGSYADDAVDVTAGKTSQDWADFFDYKPCLFKNGSVIGYLNPNDYTKFEDGSAADITSGNAGDVMVEFPRRGLKISKSGSIVTVSMTDNPDDSNFKYYAHQRGSTRKDYFYIGAYLGFSSGSKLRSLSGKSPADSISLSDCRKYARNLGSGYMNVGFYQFLFLQCMYLLQYKGNLNSQTAHGYGYCSASAKTNTGATNTKGMMYGSTSGTDHVKLFGIEDFWGNLWWWLDGYINSNYHILTATDGFNNSGSGYTDRGRYDGTFGTFGYFNNVTGTSETGFTPTSFDGSSSTYFCDDGGLNYSGTVPYAGCRWNRSTDAGAFQFVADCEPTRTDSGIGGRLGYL